MERRYNITLASTAIAASGIVFLNATSPVIDMVKGQRMLLRQMDVALVPADTSGQLSIQTFCLGLDLVGANGVGVDFDIIPNMPDARQAFPALTAGAASGGQICTAAHAPVSDRYYSIQVVSAGGKPVTGVRAFAQFVVKNADAALPHSLSVAGVVAFAIENQPSPDVA